MLINKLNSLSLSFFLPLKCPKGIQVAFCLQSLKSELRNGQQRIPILLQFHPTHWGILSMASSTKWNPEAAESIHQLRRPPSNIDVQLERKDFPVAPSAPSAEGEVAFLWPDLLCTPWASTVSSSSSVPSSSTTSVLSKSLRLRPRLLSSDRPPK